MTNENDWVTQNVVPRRPDVDEFRWIKKDGTASSWLLTPEDYNGLISGAIVLESRLEVRCKLKDHPVLGKVKSRMVSQDELNAAPKTRAWTFGTPAQTGHFLISYKDPAIEPQEIFANTISSGYKGSAIWFIYLGQTSDFADPVVPKAKYTLMMDPNEPSAHWYREPNRVQDKLDQGWVIVKEQEFEVPEWDR
jgi:hypothetical protein